jgi:hypothetical protein
MKNKAMILALFFASVFIIAQSCSKEATVVTPPDYSLAEEFDTVSNAVAKGWIIKNNTLPLGTMSWEQGYFYFSIAHTYKFLVGPINYPSAGGFGSNNPSFSGTDFIMTTSECGTGVAHCSNWLISPELTVKDGDVVSFYTRTYDNPTIAADRLEVRMNDEDASTEVGKTPTSTGKFNKVLLDINPDYLLEGAASYPGNWKKYSVIITGVPDAKKTRIAFRYYVPNGGPLGENGLGVALDKFSFQSK